MNMLLSTNMLFSVLVAIGAGLASVLSPCVLPIVPIVMAGAERKDRVRPLLLVLGLSLSFVVMGAVSSLFGGLLIGSRDYLATAGAVMIVMLGLMVIFDLSIFKRLNTSWLRTRGDGRLGGFALGMALGVVWVPCVGAFLSTVLTMVGTAGHVPYGIMLLAFYSLGLGVPMLFLAYSSHLLQSRVKAVARHGDMLRYLSGTVLVVFGVYSMMHGNLAF